MHSFKMPQLGNTLFVLFCFISRTQQVEAGKPICPCDTDPGGCCPFLDYKLCPDLHCYTNGGHGDYSHELAYGDESKCSLTCKEPQCGNFSVYTCGGASHCQFQFDGGESCTHTVIDGSKSHTLEVASARESLSDESDIFASIIHSSGSQKCRLICEDDDDCNFIISACKAPHHLLVCTGDDACDNSLFYHEHSKNHILCTEDGCSESVFYNAHSFNEVLIKNDGSENSFWENDYSVNIFEVYRGYLEDCVLSNTHSQNVFICFDDACEDTFFDNSYSKNMFNCTDSSCEDSIFDNSYSENEFLFDNSCRVCRFDNSYSKNEFFMNRASFDRGFATNHDSVNDFICLDDSCDSSFLDNRRSYNKFTCEEDSCDFTVFNNRHSYNQFSLEKESCQECFFFNDESENVFQCIKSCNKAVFKNSYSKNIFVCDGGLCDECLCDEDDCREYACDDEIEFDNSYSKNEFICHLNACRTGAHFDNRHSENKFICDQTSCNDFSSFDNSYSKNEFICLYNSCTESTFKNTHSESHFTCDYSSCFLSRFNNQYSRNKFVCENDSCWSVIATNTYSENYWMCRGHESCCYGIFDYSFSSTEHVCDGPGACKNSVFYVNYAEKFDLILQDYVFTIDDVLAFCYDSNCGIHCSDYSCFQLQYTCGGSYGKCLLTTQGTENQFYYHCYDGAQCELQCGDDCGLVYKESTLNCENAGYCSIDCGEGDCDYLRVQVDNSPILFKSNMEISKNCTVIVRSEKDDQSYATNYQPQYGNTYGYQNYVFQAPNGQYEHAKSGNNYDYQYNHQGIKVHSESCEFLKNACHDGVYLCNPAEYIKSRGNIAPVCAWSPYACPESDCHLSSLKIEGANIEFKPFTLEYHVSLHQTNSFIIEAHAVNSDSQIALGQMNARGSVRMTYDLALDGYGDSEVDISVCSPGKLTCGYKLYVHVEGK